MTRPPSIDLPRIGAFTVSLDTGPFLRREGRSPDALTPDAVNAAGGLPVRSPFPVRAATSERGLWSTWLARRFGTAG